MSQSGVFFVTGKLGAGKGIVAVSRIKDYLERGCQVATNMDLDLRCLLPRESNQTVIRLPDRPSADHLHMIGYGYGDSQTKTHDESKNGILVLDEMASFFNTRDWRDTERHAVIDWFRHARKWRWDCYFLVQDIESLDPQLVRALAEHVVVCKRTDKLSIPIVSSLVSLAGVDRILPKFHVAKVYYGKPENGVVVKRWVIRGNNLYGAYNTEQKFTDQFDVFKKDVTVEKDGKRVALKAGEFADGRAVYSYMPPRFLYKIDYIKSLENNLQNIKKQVNQAQLVEGYSKRADLLRMAVVPVLLFCFVTYWIVKPKHVDNTRSTGLAGWFTGYFKTKSPKPANQPSQPVQAARPLPSSVLPAPSPVHAPQISQPVQTYVSVKDKLLELLEDSDNQITSQVVDEKGNLLSLRVVSTQLNGNIRYYNLSDFRLMGYVIINGNDGIDILKGSSRLTIARGHHAPSKPQQDVASIIPPVKITP